MALTQIVELHHAGNTVLLKSESNSKDAAAHQEILRNHRINKGLGRLSIGHYCKGGTFIVPNNN